MILTSAEPAAREGPGVDVDDAVEVVARALAEAITEFVDQRGAGEFDADPRGAARVAVEALIAAGWLCGDLLAPPQTIARGILSWPGGIQVIGPLMVIPGRTIDVEHLVDAEQHAAAVTAAARHMREHRCG